MTTPSGRAIPPRAGKGVESARLKSAARLTPCTLVSCLNERPPGKGRAAYSCVLKVLVRLPAPAAEKAENEEDEHDDQDDPEKIHARSPPLVAGHLIPRAGRSQTGRGRLAASSRRRGNG